MGRKGERGNVSRSDRQKKRKFRGNQHTVEEERSFTNASAAKSLNAFFSKLLFSTRLT